LPKTLVVLPTYNEAENLPHMVAALFDLGIAGLGILVVDDNSPDGTGQIAEELAQAHPGRLQVLHRPGKQGLGTAYVAGFQQALANGADYIIEMDTDFSHPPATIPQMLAAMAEYDVAVGSRYAPGGQLDERWSPWRRLLSWWANSVYARLILGLQVHDATAGFKCFRRQVLEGIHWSGIYSNGYAFQVEVAYICQRRGYRVLEIPILFHERARGQSKMSWRVSLEAAWRVWQMKWRY
jgi:dolichol-phosphate mannosyltransferase